MRIVHILESTATGTLSMVCLIANGLAREGHKVDVIYSIRPDTPAALPGLFARNVRLHHVQMKDVSLMRSVSALRSKLIGLNPDIVHLHSSFAGFLGRISTLLALRRTAFFYSPHCISFMRRDISTPKRLLFVGLERVAALRRCVYVACSESEQQVVRRWLRQPVRLVENAVKAHAAKPGEHEEQKESDDFCVVTVGGVRPQKNPGLFAEIARRLDRPRARFVWIGDGDDALKQELRAAGVFITGWLSRRDVRSWLERADAYLSTSSWEGMPVSVVEAMMAGSATIVSDCAGNVDVVRHLETGAIFSSAAEGAELLGRVIDDPEFRAGLASRARIEAKDRFTEKRFFQQLAPVYEDELKRRQRSRHHNVDRTILRQHTS
jgi:glycosyltransferase involved in cell wall biosynthesis